MRGLFKGYDATPHHHTRVYLNGHLIDDATWAPQAEYAFEEVIPQSYLGEGTNTISVECPLDGGITEDILFVNWFEIAYHDRYVAEDDLLYFDGDGAGSWEFQVGSFATSTVALYDITLPLSPTRILSPTVEPGGETYTVTFQQTIADEHHYLGLSAERRLSPMGIVEDRPSTLHSGTNGADYLIISHGDFLTAMQPLVDHRAAQGLRTAVVDVQDIYDEFSGGVLNPAAIQDFLAYAYAHWEPPGPAYVLLVGDGNYDFQDSLGRGEPNYIPPYLADVDPWMGEVAADNRYVCVSGGDILPDMHLGRLPVKTAAEASALVTKILGYEGAGPPAGWNSQVLFVADNLDPDAGDFAALSDGLADNYLPAPYTSQKMYYGVTHGTASGARQAIIDAINEGRLLVNYIGHASIQYWASEQLFRVGDIATLTNSDRLPLMAPMTCLDGYFIHPSPSGADYSSLGESIVRAASKGAIASLSPTGMGVATGHDVLDQGLFAALFIDDVVQLGPATTQAKLHLYSQTGSYEELLDTYLLFGDPALALDVLQADVGMDKAVSPTGSVRPGDGITYTLTYSNAGPATAHHVVITDVLPTELVSPTVVSEGASLALRPGSRYVWEVADLAAGQGGVITITAVVSPSFTGSLTNTASIWTSAVESDLEDNTGRVWTVVAPYEVHLPLVFKAP